MDPTLLVSYRLNAGLSLLAQLVRDGFEIKAAFWVEATADNRLEFYIVSPLVDQLGTFKTYAAMRPSLYKLTAPRFILDELILIGEDNALAREVAAEIGRANDYSGGKIYNGMIGDLAVNWGYIYPENLYRPEPAAAKVPESLMRDLFNLVSRGPGPFPPSHVALRDGRSFDGVPVEFTMTAARPSTVKFEMVDPPGMREVPAHEIVAIN